MGSQYDNSASESYQVKMAEELLVTLASEHITMMTSERTNDDLTGENEWNTRIQQGLCFQITCFGSSSTCWSMVDTAAQSQGDTNLQAKMAQHRAG